MISEPRSGSTPDETFRGAMRGRTPDDEFTTVIVTRQGLGRDGRVWLTFNGAIKTTKRWCDLMSEQPWVRPAGR